MRLSVAFCTLFLCFWSALTHPLNATVVPDVLALSAGSLVSPINWFPVCVSPDKQPVWSGSLDSSNCTLTLVHLKHALHQFGGQDYFFYSQEYVKSGIEGGWSLPRGMIFGEPSEHKFIIDLQD